MIRNKKITLISNGIIDPFRTDCRILNHSNPLRHYGLGVDDLTLFLPPGIPTIFIVLSLIGKERDYKAPKFKCSDEKRARKVKQVNLSSFIH